jgi:hypothetical protein
MRKCLIVCSAVLFLLLSCAATQVIWDESLPADQTAIIRISSVMTITSYNGVLVQWKEGKLTDVEVALPAGNIEFIFDLEAYEMVYGGQASYKGKDMLLKYNFAAGKKYVLNFYSGSIIVWDGDTKKEIERIHYDWN